MSPSFNPLRSVAPTCIAIPVGRLDQIVRVFASSGGLALARCGASSVARNASAAITPRAVASAGADARCAAPTLSAVTAATTTKSEASIRMPKGVRDMAVSCV
jgi:hypothetical protein